MKIYCQNCDKNHGMWYLRDEENCQCSAMCAICHHEETHSNIVRLGDYFLCPNCCNMTNIWGYENIQYECRNCGKRHLLCDLLETKEEFCKTKKIEDQHTMIINCMFCNKEVAEAKITCTDPYVQILGKCPECVIKNRTRGNQ